MPRRRWLPRGRREPLTQALRLYLTAGDYNAAMDTMADDDPGKLDLFQLAGAVIRGRLNNLRMLWREHGVEVKSTHPALCWAEYTLRESERATVPVQGEVRRRR